MLFRTHFVFAVFVCLIFFRFLEVNFYDKIIFGIFLLFSTLFVDIDSTKSKLGSYWIFRPFQIFFSHRGRIHSLFFAFVLSFFIYFFSVPASAGFFIGYVCHLFLDLFTQRGVLLFWPFSKKRVCVLGMKSGKVLEDVLFVLLLLCDFFIVVFLLLNIYF